MNNHTLSTGSHVECHKKFLNFSLFHCLLPVGFPLNPFPVLKAKQSKYEDGLLKTFSGSTFASYTAGDIQGLSGSCRYVNA